MFVVPALIQLTGVGTTFDIYNPHAKRVTLRLQTLRVVLLKFYQNLFNVCENQRLQKIQYSYFQHSKCFNYDEIIRRNSLFHNFLFIIIMKIMPTNPKL